MSSTSGLERRVAELESEVAGLRSLVLRLEARLGELESAGGESTAASAVDFELVSSAAGPSTAAATAAASLSAERIKVAEGIGAWVRRCLRAEPRGLSGREKVPLASKFYLVVRTFDQVVHNPPLVFSSWAEAKAVCYNRGQPGDSIFVGLPSKAEVRVVITTALLELPAALRQ